MPKNSALSRQVEMQGAIVPLPWPQLAAYVQPRPGDLVILLGAPGVGKSTLGANWAYSLDKPALLVSLDTTLRDQAVRVAAMKTNRTVEEVARGFDEEPGYWKRWLQRDRSLVRWSDTSMIAEDLPELLEAEKEFLGEVPSLVVVDVISDVVEREDMESYSTVFRSLHRAARKFKTVAVGLHHLKRGSAAATGNIRFGQAEGRFSGEGGAEIVLGLWKPTEDVVMVAVLKNRRGRCDPSGEMAFALSADLSRARIGNADSVAVYMAGFGGPR